MKKYLLILILLFPLLVYGQVMMGIVGSIAATEEGGGGGELGDDMIANGDFHDGNDWELPEGLATIGSGILTVNGTAWNTFLAQSHNENANLDLVQSTTYRVTFTVVSRTSGNFYVRVSGTEDVDHIWNTTGTHTTDIVAGAGDPPQVAFISFDAGFVGTIDNIMIQEVL